MRRGTIFKFFAIAAIGAAGARPADPPAQTEPDLTKPAGKEWLHVGGDWSNSRYSTLTQLTPANIKNLKGAWVTHLGSGLGAKYSLEATPIVKDGVMYVTTGNDDVFALDAKTGALIWEHKSGLTRTSPRSAAAGTIAASPSARARSFSASSTAPSSRWMPRPASSSGRRKSANGRTATPSPPRRPITKACSTGVSGGDRSARGKLTALDAKTGKELWHFWTAAGPGERGGDTWPSPNDPDPDKAHAYLNGGANVWQAPAIDPELGLIYFSTGQPGPDAVGEGSKRPGDNLFQLIDSRAASGRHLCLAFPDGASRSLGFRLSQPGRAVRPGL